MAHPSNTGITYDASGNTLTDGINTYTMDAESQIKTVAGLTYSYDGDGNRVKKSSGKIYWYGAGSEVLDESDAAGTLTDEYVFFGGKRVAHRVVASGSISGQERRGKTLLGGVHPMSNGLGRLKNGNRSGDLSKVLRCGARNRRGTPCGGPAMKNGRCRLHGGLSTGARTAEGIERIRRAKTIHGRYSTAARSEAREFTELFQSFRKFLEEVP